MISDNKTSQATQQKPTQAPESKTTDLSTIATLISKELQLPLRGVENTLTLLSEGCTVPFIARYRKERTGALDEVSIINIKDLNDKLTDINKRRATILSTIEAQLSVAGTLPHSKTYTCPTSPRSAQGRKWHASTGWSLLPKPSCWARAATPTPTHASSATKT